MEVNIKAPTSEISAKDIVIHVWRLSVYRSKSNKCNKVFLLSRALIPGGGGGLQYEKDGDARRLA